MFDSIRYAMRIFSALFTVLGILIATILPSRADTTMLSCTYLRGGKSYGDTLTLSIDDVSQTVKITLENGYFFSGHDVSFEPDLISWWTEDRLEGTSDIHRFTLNRVSGQLHLDMGPNAPKEDYYEGSPQTYWLCKKAETQF